MAKKRIQLVLEIVLLLVLVSSQVSCGSSRASSQATPRATAPQRLDTGPLGLPLYCPIIITHDQQGNLYVTDSDQGYKGSHRARIVKLSPSGQLLAEWHVFNTLQSQPSFVGNVTGPFGLAADAQGNMYVAGLRNHRLVKFSPAGRFLTAWSGAGGIQFSSARVVAVDRAGNIYLTDAKNFRIVKFSPTGKVLAIWQRPMDLFLFGITVDPQGNIYVAMTNVPNNGGPRGGVRKLSPSGAVLATWPATCPP
jgi:DNA-binding beta-propeller fold protein YncE